MDRELLIDILNKKDFNNYSNVELLFKEFLKDKNIEELKIKAFIHWLYNNDINVISIIPNSSIMVRCLNYCISQLVKKYNINTISKDNKVLFYY